MAIGMKPLISRNDLWKKSKYYTLLREISLVNFKSIPMPDDNYPYVQYDSWSWGYVSDAFSVFTM